MKLHLCFCLLLQLYQVHFEQARNIMLEMEHTMRQNREFEKAVNDFEAEKVCFLPLNAFILKPTQRIIYYKQILESKQIRLTN